MRAGVLVTVCASFGGVFGPRQLLFEPELCASCTVGVAYEMPTSEVSNINPNMIENSIFFTKYLQPRIVHTAYIVCDARI